MCRTGANHGIVLIGCNVNDCEGTPHNEMTQMNVQERVVMMEIRHSAERRAGRCEAGSQLLVMRGASEGRGSKMDDGDG